LIWGWPNISHWPPPGGGAANSVAPPFLSIWPANSFPLLLAIGRGES